jgi:hypothetical protein
MPTPWAPTTVTESTIGHFRLFIHPPGARAVDVTFFRNQPIQIDSYSSADPFGDSTLTFSFPQISPMEATGSGELDWLRDFADVDLILIPPNYDPALRNFTRIWEGFIASMDFHLDSTSHSLQVQCQGALFQVDKTLAKPRFPMRPVPYETLIKAAFNPTINRDLRTQPLTIEWPAGWSKVAPASNAVHTVYTPVGVQPGEKITGFSGRSTGAWDHMLTSFIQGLLQVMVTDDIGSHWTIRKDPNRKPVMYVRKQKVPPTWTVTAGIPGLTLSLSRDLTQFANVIYGQGSDPAGVTWNREAITGYSSALTGYVPLAWDLRAWPPTKENKWYDPELMKVEAYIKYDNGFDERQAQNSAFVTLGRDEDPGLAGNATLNVDPEEGSRYLIKGGDSIKIKHLRGKGTDGVIFHIASASTNVNDGTVNLTIDTKFRDLLTVEEVLQRTRDPLTPVKMLQVGQRSLMIEDRLAPWDYTKGSGFVPETSTPLFKAMPLTTRFPYESWTKTHPPRTHPHYYVQVRANASTRSARWTIGAPVPIRLSEKGDIRMTQIAAYDINGNQIRVPFHFAVYKVPVTASDMPYDDHGPSPFLPNAFQSTNQYGQEIPADDPGATQLKQDSMIIGWGNRDQPAGYSPGMKSNGDPCTGKLIDETGWSFDSTDNPDFQKNPRSGEREPESAITYYGAFYAEWHDYVYFVGRLFRKEAGQ